MAYDEVLASRVRDLAPLDMTEKNVFGARCWLIDGNMSFGVADDELLVRLGSDGGEGLRGFDPMESGKPMKGWFLIGQDELAEDHELKAWMDKALAFTSALPPK